MYQGLCNSKELCNVSLQCSTVAQANVVITRANLCALFVLNTEQVRNKHTSPCIKHEQHVRDLPCADASWMSTSGVCWGFLALSPYNLKRLHMCAAVGKRLWRGCGGDVLFSLKDSCFPEIVAKVLWSMIFDFEAAPCTSCSHCCSCYFWWWWQESRPV